MLREASRNCSRGSSTVTTETRNIRKKFQICKEKATRLVYSEHGQRSSCSRHGADTDPVVVDSNSSASIGARSGAFVSAVASASAWSLFTRANDGPALCQPLWWPSCRAPKVCNSNAVNLPKDQTVHVFLRVICFKPHPSSFAFHTCLCATWRDPPESRLPGVAQDFWLFVAESQKRLCEANTIAMFPHFYSWISDYVTLQQHVVDMKPLNKNAAPLPTT